MRITVRASGLLVRYLPENARGKEAELEVPEGATPAQVVAQLGMPAERRYLVIRNGTAVPRAEHDTLALSDGDTLAIVPPLKGG